MNKILIADNMSASATLIGAYLSQSGFEVQTAASGTAAMRKARIFRPALLILDIILPGISGFDVCKLLKSDPETANIIILFVTSLDSKDMRTRAYELGAGDFMTKPFNQEALLTRIRELLRVKELSDELETQYARVRDKNQQLEFQMKMARQVQQALVEEYALDINGVKITSKYLPALDIGGDLYDIVKPNADSVCIFIADVSGHGISAALLTSMLKIMFEAAVATHPRPDLLLEKMNQTFFSIFSHSDISVYACAFYAYIDVKNRRITYSNAGHALPLFVDHTANQAWEVQSGGIPLGMMDNSSYELKTQYYNQGDMVLFYTDGLSDALYKDAPEEFIHMLKGQLLDLKTEDSSEIILRAIQERFCRQDELAPYETDDISLILCKM